MAHRIISSLQHFSIFQRIVCFTAHNLYRKKTNKKASGSSFNDLHWLGTLAHNLGATPSTICWQVKRCRLMLIFYFSFKLQQTQPEVLVIHIFLIIWLAAYQVQGCDHWKRLFLLDGSTLTLSILTLNFSVTCFRQFGTGATTRQLWNVPKTSHGQTGPLVTGDNVMIEC